MSPKLRHVVGLAVIAAAAAGLVLARSAREPFDGSEWSVESVMVLDEGGPAAVHRLRPPFRVLRDGRLTLCRPDENPTVPVVRVDLTIDGEPVVVFARLRPPPAAGD
ncbi:MAG TPA: hypothetical protein VGF55_06235 [Gemmataceae bacterium]|jgi:hypothetical protein